MMSYSSTGGIKRNHRAKGYETEYEGTSTLNISTHIHHLTREKGRERERERERDDDRDVMIERP